MVEGASHYDISIYSIQSVTTIHIGGCKLSVRTIHCTGKSFTSSNFKVELYSI